MNRLHFLIWANILFILALIGCQAPGRPAEKIAVPPPSGTVEPIKTEQIYQYKHELKESIVYAQKPVVALLRTGDIIELGDVLPFGRQMVIQSEGEEGGAQVVKGAGELQVVLPLHVREYLIQALVNSKRLIVVDRERIIEIVRELTAGESEVIEPVTSPQKGRLFGVHYILEATFFKGGSDAAFATVRSIPRFEQTKEADRISVLLVKAYDVETGQIIASVVGAHENPALAAKDAVQQLLRSFKARKDIRVVSFDTRGNPVLDRGSTSGINVGDRFSAVVPSGKKVELEVWKVDPLSSVMKVLTGDPSDLQIGQVAMLQSAKGQTPETEER